MILQASWKININHDVKPFCQINWKNMGRLIDTRETNFDSAASDESLVYISIFFRLYWRVQAPFEKQ